MMIDFQTAKILGHRRNIQRYARLLAGELTELERQYVHKRIAEELKPAKAQNEHDLSMRVKMATSAAKPRLSRSGRLDTRTRSIQAHLRAARS
jgi:hypothetical protein